jgi:hypothetical protein
VGIFYIVYFALSKWDKAPGSAQPEANQVRPGKFAFDENESGETRGTYQWSFGKLWF